MAETSLINAIAIHATASTNAPTLPSKGTNITQATWNSAGFVVGGKVDSIGNDFDLDDPTTNFLNFVKEFEVIRAPRGNAPEDHILLSQRSDPFEVVVYGADETLYALDSNASITSNKFTTSDTTTKRTVVVEVGGGLYIVYFPQCVVTLLGDEGGFASGGVVKATMEIMPERTSTYDAGFYKEWYQ